MPDLPDFSKPPPTSTSSALPDFSQPPPDTGYDRALADERKSLKGQEWAVPVEMGITFGQGPDIDATITRANVAAQNLGRRVTGQSIPYTSDEAARATGAGEREAAAGFRARHPVASLGEELAGGVATTIATRGLAPEAAAPTMFSRVLRSALTGAGFGAATSEGEAGGDIKHRAGAATVGGAAGAALGGLVPMSEPVLQGIFRGANRLAQGAGMKGWESAAQSAEKRLTDALRQDGVTPDKIKTAIKEWKDAGTGAVKLLEVAGENTMGLIRAASSRFGPARNIAAKNAFAERVDLGPTAADRAGTLTSETRSAPEVRQSLEQERDALAEKQYRSAYAQPVPVTPQLLTELRDQEGQQAINAAIKGARAMKDYDTVRSLQTLQGILSANTKIDPRLPPSVRELLVKKYLQKIPPVTGAAVDKVRIALNALGAQTKNPQMGAGFFDRANRIGEVLDDVPALKAARATYHSMSDKIRGLDIGEAALTKPTSAFSQLLKTAGGKGKSPKPMTPEMLEQARTGARQWIQDELGKKPTQARQALEKIAFGKDVRANLESLFGKDEAARYVKDAQLRIHRLTRAQDISPRTGSQTQPRGQDITSLIGGWKGALSKAMDHLTTPGMDEKEAEALVRAGLGDPSVLIASFARKPVLRQALARTAPVVGSQAGRTLGSPDQ